MTVDDIRRAMTSRGSHWWEPSSMRFFGTRASATVYSGPGGHYFVTTEKPPHGPRRASVRQYLPETCDIRTVGTFCAYSRSFAQRLASAYASGDKAALDRILSD